MLLTVAERASIPTVIVRLGQISGDITGHWNEREWFPTLVKSAEFTKCLPDVEGVRILVCICTYAYLFPLRSAERLIHPWLPCCPRLR